jgi:hypothetical protein
VALVAEVNHLVLLEPQLLVQAVAAVVVILVAQVVLVVVVRVALAQMEPQELLIQALVAEEQVLVVKMQEMVALVL